ncbi:MAG: hypothetical protein A3J62_03120 [Candidatus Buchananbacteria bacterium RIFCSPHIGHO2_02_FULL_38_8]|uniref:Uncharacterized protein n=2 Tax=Candidatus Buchananiibacteriota TaxID=1817903 RepID=A0A1G1XTH8_9BACT|nr:MAG: hypothetical protein A2731_00545 [Candidatus Buchananbacteria bacterium RIFCSPHIGHO2_01_FULL_39_8]OGY47167.1 MAG: hypothetical protein A3J62_03120 [Candidatus Buchananbacteria bacterium RIFCSPHIGHO2_02_FULL_38_8]
MAQKPKKSKIDQMPEDVRKTILWLTLTILTIIICSFWLYSLKFSLTPSAKDTAEKKEQEKQWEEIQQNFSNLLDQTKQGFNAIKEQVSGIEELVTTTPEFSEEQIKKIKEKLEGEEIKNNNEQPILD